jgi:hypothetical protein
MISYSNLFLELASESNFKIPLDFPKVSFMFPLKMTGVTETALKMTHIIRSAGEMKDKSLWARAGLYILV